MQLRQGDELSYLSGRDKLQGAEGRLEVGDVGLELVEGGCDGGLEFGGVLAGGAVGGDLVEGWLGHGYG